REQLIRRARRDDLTGSDLVAIREYERAELAPRHVRLGDRARANLAAGRRQLLDEELADRVPIAAQRRRAGDPRIECARDRRGRCRGMTHRDRREPAPDRSARIGLGIAPPRSRGLRELVGELTDLALLEEADAGERVLAGEDRIEQPRDLRT